MKKLAILIGILVIISCGLLAAACDEDEPTATLVTPPPQLLELDPCCQGDSPGCTNCQPNGFNDGGAWDPSGSSIQEIALDTVGTKESCWDDVGRWGGKPFWQMVLGNPAPTGWILVGIGLTVVALVLLLEDAARPPRAAKA